jgi:hypothetical protein
MSRRLLKISAALMGTLTVLSLGYLMAGKAAAALWQPRFDFTKAGNYCRVDLKQNVTERRGPREPRFGPIIVRDYEQPLRELVAKAGAAGERRLSIGPSTVRVLASQLGDGRRLRVGGGRFGTVIANFSRRSTGRLAWKGIASIASVDRNGRVTRQLAKRGFSIGTLGPNVRRQVLLPTGNIPGIYRFDLVLESTQKDYHHRFSDYVRVLAPAMDARLTTKEKVYHSGDIIYARVENLGSSVLHDATEYVVEVKGVSGAWRRVGPEGVGFPRGPGLPLGSGKARCFGLQVPSTAANGAYRVTKEIKVESSTISLAGAFSVE